jgi:hypothetical protein
MDDMKDCFYVELERVFELPHENFVRRFQCRSRERSYFQAPWSRVLLEKLIVTHLLKKFPAFYRTQMFITVFTRARHWSLSRAKYMQSKPSVPIFLRSILILSSDLRQWTFPLRCSNQNIGYISNLSRACYTPLPSPPILLNSIP